MAWTKWFFENRKRTMLLLAMLLLMFIAVFVFVLYFYSNNFYTNHSDDFQQYFSIMEDFTSRLKNNTFSFYSFGNYLGSSFFADAYYIPFDLFSFITVILSFFMQFEFAFSTTELIKLFLGVLAFAYYLMLKGNSNKVCLLVSLIYMICGGNVIIMAFPTYYSLVFYLPFSLICLEYFFQGKKYVIPLMTVILIFYDFYIAYTVLLFVAIVFVIELMIRYKWKDWKKVLFQGIECAVLVILGILMGMVILLPSTLYILNDTYRVTNQTYWYTFYNGSLLSDQPAFFSLIQDRDHFFRVIAELFTPQAQIGYYGFQNSYITDHLSMFITTTGFICLLFVYSIKGKKEFTIYKALIPLELLMVLLPLFYMLFSGNAAPYCRWLIILSVFNLIVLARVLSVKNLRLEMTSLGSICRNIVVIMIILICIGYYAVRLYAPNSEELLTSCYIDFFNYFNRFIAKCIYEIQVFSDIGVFIKECFSAVVVFVCGLVLEINNFFAAIGCIFAEIQAIISGSREIQKEAFSQYYYLVNDIWYMFVAIAIVILLTGLSYIKRVNFVPLFLAGEIIYGAIFMCNGPFVSRNRLNQVNQRDKIDAYLDTYLPYDSNFQRVLVGEDINAGITVNIARTTSQITNLDLFHSFYDKNSDAFSETFFGKSEGAGKYNLEKLNSVYLDILLGRTYIMLQENSLLKLPDCYQLVDGTSDGFSLYKSSFSPMTIYNKYALSSDEYVNGISNNGRKRNYTYRQAYFLNNMYYNGDLELGLEGVDNNEYSVEMKYKYLTSGNDVPWDVVTHYAGRELLGYYLNDFIDYDYPEKGLMKFFYPLSPSSSKSESGTDIETAYLGYIDKFGNPTMITQCTSRYCYYDQAAIKEELGENQLMIFVSNTASMRKAKAENLVLTLEISNYQPLDDYIVSQSYYSKQKLTIDGSNLNVSFSRVNIEPIVVCIPITYNSSWVCSNPDYQVINVNGGMTGILINHDKTDIAFTLSFKNKGLKEGALVSAGGFAIYGAYMYFSLGRKKEEDYYPTFTDKTRSKSI